MAVLREQRTARLRWEEAMTNPIAAGGERTIPCPHCGRKFATPQALMQHDHTAHPWAAGQRHDRRVRRKVNRAVSPPPPSTDADWGGSCLVCGCGPTVPETGMCGPCTFGEADTVGGNW